MRRGLVVVGAVVAGLLIGGAQLWQSQARAKVTIAAEDLPEVKAILTSAPAVPPPVDRPGNAKVIVDLETTEVKGTLADGVQYTFWTFGGTVPGPFVRVREGDVVQIRLKNAAKSMHPHSIDLHAVTGPGGGAAVTQLTGPGGRLRVQGAEPGALRLSLRDPERAQAHRQRHVRTDPGGAREGAAPGGPRVLRHAGRVLHQGQDLAPGLQAIDRAKLTAERPEYVVFNGKMGALLDDGGVKAKVGETVRLFVGNGGPNLISSFHVIGEIFDTVYTEGAVGGGTPARNVQTTLVPSGGAAIVEMQVQVPGRFLLVDHSIVRAMEKGALGVLEVAGAEPGIFKTLVPGTHGTGGH